MDWSPYVSAGIGLAGSIFSGISSKRNSEAAFNRQIAWERERATHAHQWEVADLKAAGLNPILSATGGSGAQTSGVSQPPIDTPNHGEALTRGYNSAQRLNLETKANEANIQKIQSETDENRENIRVSQLNNTIQMYQAELESKLAHAEQIHQQGRLLKEEADQLAQRAGLILIEYNRNLQLLENSKKEADRIEAQTNLYNLQGNLSVLQGLYTTALTNFTNAGIDPREIDGEYQQAFSGSPIVRRVLEGSGRAVTGILGGVLPFLVGKHYSGSRGPGKTPPAKLVPVDQRGKPLVKPPRKKWTTTIGSPIYIPDEVYDASAREVEKLMKKYGGKE